jgi:hypothetical protein
MIYEEVLPYLNLAVLGLSVNSPYSILGDVTKISRFKVPLSFHPYMCSYSAYSVIHIFLS